MSRKNENRIIIIFTMVLCLIFCSGCSDINFSDNTLIRPPRATGDKADIQDIIAKEAGGAYSLKYPQSGEYRSAITMYKSENIEECAIAFYSTENDTNMYVSIIFCNDNEWKCAGTFVNSGAGVDCLMFYDIDGDKKEEIIIGWNNYNSNLKSLTVYSFDMEQMREIVIDDTYNNIVISNITGNKTDDIILLSQSTSDAPSTIKLLQYSEQEKRPISKFYLELDPNITNFSNIFISKIDKDKYGIVIDGEKIGGVLTTQIVYFDNEKLTLVNPLVTEENNTFNNITSRKDIVLSCDIDNDGIVEVPVTNQMPASTDENIGTVCNMISWKQIISADGTTKTKQNTVRNYTDGYYFIMPERWRSTVTARIDPDNRKMIFYIWNSKTNSIGDELLSIYRFTQNEWNSMDKKDFILLETLSKNANNAVFAAQILNTSSKDELNIKKNEVIFSVKSIN